MAAQGSNILNPNHLRLLLLRLFQCPPPFSKMSDLQTGAGFDFNFLGREVSGTSRFKAPDG